MNNVQFISASMLNAFVGAKKEMYCTLSCNLVLYYVIAIMKAIIITDEMYCHQRVHASCEMGAFTGFFCCCYCI